MSKKAAQLGQEMVLLGMYDDYEMEDFLLVLRAADDLYYNDEQSFISDADYDAIRKFAEQLEPHNSYFTGVGSEVRGGKVKLPYTMGSLDQIDIGDITDWIGNWTLQQHFVIISDKLDGTSAMVIYDENGDLQIAYSRGNGIEGADITRHIKHIVPKNVGRKMVVRGEVIIPNKTWGKVKKLVKTRGNTEYKNQRNCVAGLMNSKTNPDMVYPLIDFVAYEILDYEESKGNMLSDLRDVSFKTPIIESLLGKQLNDLFLTNYLELRRERTDYEIDGLVLDVDAAQKRVDMNPTRDTLNPAYAVKYKVADASNQAIARVIGVEWAVSKHGYLKPRVNIEPVDLVGVTINYATGFNAKFIYENKIGPGAKVKITRSGDVIPFIQGVERGTTPQMPDEDWEWNDTEVDAVMIDHHKAEEVTIQQVLSFFQTIDAPNLKEGTIRTMFEEHDYTSFSNAALSMCNYAEDHWVSCIGANGSKIYNGLRKKLTNIPLYKLMGAVPYFSRGVGTRKFKKLLKDLTIKVVDELSFLNKAQIVMVDSFEDKTASKIVAGMNDFLVFMRGINSLTIEVAVTNNDGVLKDQKVVFTGFRDKDLQAAVEAEGGTMQTAVSGKTNILVTKDPNSNSGKAKKARAAGVNVMGIDEFKTMIGA